MTGRDARDLFDLVEEYSNFGDHRSGSTEQSLTSEWLAELLRDRGGTVEKVPIEFPRYVADWTVSIDGDRVDALPLFYEATGSVASNRPHRRPVFSPTGSGPLGVSGAAPANDDGVEPGDLVVAATQNLLGLLAVSNRAPGPGGGVHVLQVAGHHGGALADGTAVRASIDARVEPSTCDNVIARFGNPESSDRLVVVTTPISGWFSCAGERGTGIAAAVELATRLAHETPVLFLGATGHELGGIGAASFRDRFAGRVDTLIHVGANIGCDWPASAELAAPDHSYLSARFAGPTRLREPLTAAFAPTGHGLDMADRDRSAWFGEAADWLDVPCLLSLLGQNPWFHSPTDRPEVSCTAARTALVTDALTEAALALVHR
jgi:hypothetical protein